MRVNMISQPKLYEVPTLCSESKVKKEKGLENFIESFFEGLDLSDTTEPTNASLLIGVFASGFIGEHKSRKGMVKQRLKAS